MRDFIVRTAIAAPPQTVWPILADLERWPEWTASMQSVTRLDAGALGTGSRVRVAQPKLRPAVFTITEWQPERNFTWASSTPAVRATAGHLLEPSATGCDLVLRLRFEGWAGGLAGWLMRDLVERYMAMEGEGLKQRSEAAAGAAPPA
ncbi:MAG TPA: SRPBCC family protein [Burkholderiales bacterium]|jgi:uncharacterized protein YndB with AHSA1/START domain|nr:SRPBCC family protein [Burkholderiales bacterium]